MVGTFGVPSITEWDECSFHVLKVIDRSSEATRGFKAMEAADPSHFTLQISRAGDLVPLFGSLRRQ